MLTRDNVLELYYDCGLSLRQVAQKLGITLGRLLVFMKKEGLVRRNKNQAQSQYLKTHSHMRTGVNHSNESKSKIANGVENFWKKITPKDKQNLDENRRLWRSVPKDERNRILSKIKSIQSIDLSNDYKELIKVFKKRKYNLAIDVTRFVLNKEVKFELILSDLSLVIKIDDDLHYDTIYGEEYLRIMQEKDLVENMYIKSAGYSVLRVRHTEYTKKWFKIFDIKLRKIKQYGKTSVWYI